MGSFVRSELSSRELLACFVLGAEPFLVDVLRFRCAEILDVESVRLDPTRFVSSKALCFFRSEVLCFEARCLSSKVFGFSASGRV